MGPKYLSWLAAKLRLTGVSFTATCLTRFPAANTTTQAGQRDAIDLDMRLHSYAVILLHDETEYGHDVVSVWCGGKRRAWRLSAMVCMSRGILDPSVFPSQYLRYQADKSTRISIRQLGRKHLPTGGLGCSLAGFDRTSSRRPLDSTVLCCEPFPTLGLQGGVLTFSAASCRVT
uniref:Uncharacterized protein n=1 Tax=Mycena chlorophos TaxID=658473 RepID=A0ABQ0LC55_MYCCL|nr:predicted protein [Mycena chlorophos]